MIEYDLAAAGLRALVYAGSIAVAGGIMFTLSFPDAARAVEPVLKRQIVAGFCLLLVVEPLRYGVFQLAIAGGDWSLAFGPDMRWMGFETPIGRTAALRLVAAAVAVGLRSRAPALALVAAIAMLGTFLLEGHTASTAARIALAPLLLIHLAAVHWWLGALLPLRALTRRGDPATVVTAVEAFGARALWVVVALLAAGVTLALVLTGGVLDLAVPYQQRLLVKVVVVAALLAIAAWNKLRLTPLLRADYGRGAARLRASISVEIVVALTVLMATAWMVATAPDDV